MDFCFELSCGDRWEFKGRLNVCSSKSGCICFGHILFVLLSQCNIFLRLSDIFFSKFHFNEHACCVSTNVFNLVLDEAQCCWRSWQLHKWSRLFWTPVAHYCAPQSTPVDPVLSCSLRSVVSRLTLNILLVLVSYLRPCFSRACLSLRCYNSNLCALHRNVVHIHPSSPSLSWSQ